MKGVFLSCGMQACLVRISTIAALLLLTSCRERVARNETTLIVDSPNSHNFPISGEEIIRPATWTDSIITDYIKHSSNEQINQTKADSTTELTYMFEGVVESDTAIYLMYKIGHSFEHRYLTDAWIYLDSNKRTLYEYDIANESLLMPRY